MQSKFTNFRLGPTPIFSAIWTRSRKRPVKPVTPRARDVPEYLRRDVGL